MPQDQMLREAREHNEGARGTRHDPCLDAVLHVLVFELDQRAPQLHPLSEVLHDFLPRLCRRPHRVRAPANHRGPAEGSTTGHRPRRRMKGLHRHKRQTRGRPHRQAPGAPAIALATLVPGFDPGDCLHRVPGRPFGSARNTRGCSRSIIPAPGRSKLGPPCRSARHQRNGCPSRPACSTGLGPTIPPDHGPLTSSTKSLSRGDASPEEEDRQDGLDVP